MRTVFSTLVFVSFSVSAFLPPSPSPSADFIANPLAEPAETFRQDGPHQPTSLKDCQRGGWRNYPHAGFRNQGDCTRFVATGKFVCRDALGCLDYVRGGRIRLATILAVSGDAQDVGLDSQRAVELALVRQGEVLGHDLELRREDDGCSPEGGEAAANAVSSDATIAAVVGTTCSSAALVAAPILSGAGLSLVSPSNTSPLLTDPGGHEEGYLRTAFNDATNSVAMAQFLFEQGALTSAVIVGEGPSQAAIGQSFIDHLQAVGGSSLAYIATSTDGSGVAAAVDGAIVNGVPAVLYFPVLAPLGPAIVNEARSRPELTDMRLATNDYWYSQEAIDGLGPNADGLFVGLPDDSFTGSEAYGGFAADYLEAYGVDPSPFFAPHAHDAAVMILAGIRSTAIIDKKGTLHIGRQALRSALFATSELEGLTGSITCDPFGECGAASFVQIEVHAAPNPLIVGSVEGDWFWTSNFLPETLLSVSIFESADPGAALLWEGTATTDESGFVNIGFDVHVVDMAPGNYLVISDGQSEDSLVLESITMDTFLVDEDLLAGTAPPGRLVRVVASVSPDAVDQVTIELNADSETGAWSADFGALGVDITDEMRAWSFAQIFDEDGDANEAGAPPPPPDMGLRVNYGDDWVESFYEAGHTVLVTVTESDGVSVHATAEVVTAPRDDWGGEPGFQIQPQDWQPGQPDIQPNDWVYAEVSNGVSAQVQIGDISGEIDLEGDAIQGTIAVPWFSAEVEVECHSWGSPGPEVIKYDSALPNGEDTYSCAWDPSTEWDIQAGQNVGVAYSGPDGHWVANTFFITMPPRTLTVGHFHVEWSPANPEEIVDFRWNGSVNLTSPWAHPNCSGDLEYFGNSWVSENEGTPSFFFGSLVGWGTTGTWTSHTSTEIGIDSSSSGCPGSADIAVNTQYQFFADDLRANLIRVQRTFQFGADSYAHDVRPFIPRLFPADGFTQILHPDASGGTLVTETPEGCGFGCMTANWGGTWFAIHNPTTGLGMIVQHVPSTYSVALWVDEDGGSFSNASSVLLLQPPGGFTDLVTETEFLCFYDSGIWTPALTLPQGCQP